MLYYLGIDPGKSGAYALISQDLSYGAVFTHPEDVGVLLDELETILEELPVVYAAIERAQAAPGQGRSSIFNYGVNYGQWLGLLAALRLPHETVPPKKWQYKVYGSIKRRDDQKLASITNAKQKFPKVKIGKNNNKADALNIALFAREAFSAE